ncbi:WD40 repeat domain-containing protein [Tautonia rosea]|uniref:WD40 repeat domain-containing protein n=1 Tax=Tautonia rosea TaxID=2728037 RepID=UPI0014740204|nr:WD40 repeat domain-containing protein [Tautonia rosea]
MKQSVSILIALSLMLGWGVSLHARPYSVGEPPITDLAFAPDGASLVATSQRGILILDRAELRLRATLESESTNLHALAFSPSGDRLAVGGGQPTVEGTVEIRDWPGGALRVTFSEQTDSVVDLVWIDEDTIAAASLDHSIVLLEVASGKVIRRLEGHSRGVSALASMPGEGLLVSAGRDQSLRVWEIASGDLVHSLDHHTLPVNAAAPRPGGAGLAVVATAGDDRTVRFWQPAIGRMVRFVRLDSVPLALAWLPDGSRAVVSCADGRVRFIDPTTVEVTADLPAIDGWAYAIAVDPTDADLLVGGQDGRIHRVAWK